ncbi:hypothetical protein XENOCAPTIV_006402 [Xenoophorus captivus]|uniref:Uncharacterized protein n=1 Tax=Xenoophorus captivus TaxID=1517983 RepID=A0ABV0RV46_9TELE
MLNNSEATLDMSARVPKTAAYVRIKRKKQPTCASQNKAICGKTEYAQHYITRHFGGFIMLCKCFKSEIAEEPGRDYEQRGVHKCRTFLEENLLDAAKDWYRG